MYNNRCVRVGTGAALKVILRCTRFGARVRVRLCELGVGRRVTSAFEPTEEVNRKGGDGGDGESLPHEVSGQDEGDVEVGAQDEQGSDVYEQ